MSAVRHATLADGSVDANILIQGLQIDASKYAISVLIFSISGLMRLFVGAAFGRAVANPHLNPSGCSAMPQIFLKEECFGNLSSVDKFGNPGVTAYPMVNSTTPAYQFMWMPTKK